MNDEASRRLVSDIQRLCPQTVKELIKKGANVNAIDCDGNTPLHNILFRDKDWQCNIIVLMRRGADVSARNKRGQTPLHAFLSSPTCYSHEDDLQLLLKSGADVNAKAKFAVTPLHLALQNSPFNVNLVRELLTRGADVNAIDANGVSPLQYLFASSDNYEAKPEIVELLVEQGARFRLQGIGEFYAKFHDDLSKCDVNKCLIKYNEAFAGLFSRDTKQYPVLVTYEPSTPQYQQELETSRNQCVAEIKRMRQDMLVDHISVKAFFFGSKFGQPALYTPDDVYHRAYGAFTDRQYAIYHDVIARAVRKSSKYFWVDVLRQQQIHTVDVQSGKKIRLNEDCLKVLSEYLSVDDLFSLVAAWDAHLSATTLSNTLPNARKVLDGRKIRRLK